ncbi:hypothetical protein ZWY2020_043900 [Hordeum vulgare]|nr:hypothetical protein ZWY2020_043900 [Hordeum vulgare]
MWGVGVWDRRAALSEVVCHNLAPVFADGFPHWLIHPMFRFATRPVAALLYLSVADEMFSWVRPPPFDWEKGAHLTELDGRLCIVREDLPRVSVLIWLEIWKLGEQIIMVAGCWSFASIGYDLFVKQDICILCCEYLASLVDMDSINEFAWDEHFLAVALNEVKKYQKKRNEGKTALWIGGCLPMFAITYMDFVEVPRLLACEHRIDYYLSRSCFVCNDDFKLIQEIDRNKLSLDKIDFGKRNLRRLAETPYVRLDGCSEAQHQNNKFVRTDAPTRDIPSNPAFDGCEVGGDVSGSLDEWLHTVPSSEEMEIPRHMIPIYEKHKKLHAIEVKKVLKSFGKVLEAMFCKRLASILVEANATATSSNHHTPEDVTFHAPAGNAADAGHTRAPIHTSPEAHKSPAPQEVDADKEVAGCSNTKQNEAQRDIGLEKMQSCCIPGTQDVQQGPVLGEREKSESLKSGWGDLKDPDVADEGQNVILSQGTMAALQGLALEFDDGPSMSMFKEGTEDFEWLNMDDNTARKYKEENNGI